ncbi:serine/threonine protein kinase [Mucilaginibacter myungsuensis]|uniref:Serine/threonine protein kinase n=1 Tax=Mucilaginibacter myungsuensis TaxID=649104 RepID=A0A929PY00_9SPHI|nr:serine/threonine-protein kinase [Mucilaginibacter myungsuensis]MBE9663711.1 serine/threonine protein kinase [Mucilaginibacter myungsuensis]MDN3598965.1 serine/threonine-protein kinase [Mucilaginibacter myungsuensis]
MSKVFTIAEGLENMGALRTGGQGSVYKGRRMGPIISAVKILPTPIHSESTEDKNYRAFLNEVEKLKKVNEIPNPNVVKILNSGITESGSFPFIEMEYIDGPDLGELLTDQKIFTIKEVIKVADQLSCALSHCHKVAVKHGDIKSNNIKFNIHTGNYMLLDFGLSIMSDEQRRTSMRHAGAIEFMAPEQNEGQMLFQTDVYSYGIILYELLTGQVPFPLKDNGETARNTVMVAHMEAPVPDILQLRNENLPEDWTAKQKRTETAVPAWLTALIYKCLEKSPEKRFTNGMELHDVVADSRIADVVVEEVKKAIPIAEQRGEVFVDPVTQAPNSDNSNMLISKTVFACLMILLAGFMGFSTYVLFKDRTAKPNTALQRERDSVPYIDTTAVNQAYRRGYYSGKKSISDSVAKAKITEDIYNNGGEGTDSAATDTTNNRQPNF